MDVDLAKVLKNFSSTINKYIIKGVSEGNIVCSEEEYFVWKVTDFEYTDTGIKSVSRMGEYITDFSFIGESNWILNDLKKTDEYDSILNKLKNIYSGRKNITSDFQNFIKTLVENRLSRNRLTTEGITKKINNFLNYLNNEPVIFNVVIELEGIILQPEKIEIFEGLVIRRTKANDLEKKIPKDMFYKQTTFSNPTAIFNLEVRANDFSEIQLKIEQYIAIFRLFKVGSVKYVSYNINSEFSLFGRGTFSSINNLHTHEKYLITIEDVQNLKRFWRKMSDIMPNNFYDTGSTNINYLSIAYKRYSDALFQNGSIESRFSNAIMGLEAIYFKPSGEMQELAYRLRIRVSKLLGLLGYDSKGITNKIKDAYGVRSSFLHGGHLSHNTRKKLDSRYGLVNNLLYSIIDYLRISIIVTLLINKNKEEFIDLIDDSLIDRKSEEQLNNIILKTKKFTESTKNSV